MKACAIIKSAPGKIYKTRLLTKRLPNVIVISLTEYVKWELARHNIKSLLFATLSPFKDTCTLHNELKKKYDVLCCNVNKKNKLNYADLFRAHLCWEIQKEYYFLTTLERWLYKYNIKKLYFEHMPLKKTKRYAKDINRLIGEYCAKRNIAFKKI